MKIYQQSGFPAPVSILSLHSIPPKPEGPVNPAELPLAEAVLATSQVDLIPTEARPVLYRRLVPQFTALSEELWDLMFGEAPGPECKVIALRQTA